MTGGDTETSEITSRAELGSRVRLLTTIKIPRCLLTTDHGAITVLHNIRDDILLEAIFGIDDVRNIFLCGIMFVSMQPESSYFMQISQYDNARAKLYAYLDPTWKILFMADCQSHLLHLV